MKLLYKLDLIYLIYQNYFLIIFYKMKGVKMKVNMDVVNCVLLFVILALVIYCVVKQNENFQDEESAINGVLITGENNPNPNAKIQRKTLPAGKATYDDEYLGRMGEGPQGSPP